MKVVCLWLHWDGDAGGDDDDGVLRCYCVCVSTNIVVESRVGGGTGMIRLHAVCGFLI